MKKLFVIRTIIKDYFTAQLPVTAVVLLAFILSFNTLFFVTTRTAAENLESTGTENIYYNELRMDFEKIESEIDPEILELRPNYPNFGMYMLDDKFYNAYLKIGLPPISDGGYITAYIKYSKLNGQKLAETDFVDVPAYPRFSESEKDRYEPFKYELRYDYEITEGRDITEEDLKNHRYYAVAPEGWAVKVGDKLDCFGHELEIIGLLKPSVAGYQDDVWYIPNRERFIAPYYFFNECMSDRIELPEGEMLKFNTAYSSKPQNNKYEPVQTEYPEYSNGETPNSGDEVYPAFVTINFDNVMFSQKISESQKKEYAEFLGITPDMLTSSFEQYYKDVVKEFNKKAIGECIAAGAFCALNVIMIVMFLCRKNIADYRLFRVYGSSKKDIFIFNILSMLSLIVIVLIFCCATSKPVMMFFESINPKYEFRLRCLIITAIVFVTVSLLACIPAAVSAVRRTPVNK